MGAQESKKLWDHYFADALEDTKKTSRIVLDQVQFNLLLEVIVIATRTTQRWGPTALCFALTHLRHL